MKTNLKVSLVLPLFAALMIGGACTKSSNEAPAVPNDSAAKPEASAAASAPATSNAAPAAAPQQALSPDTKADVSLEIASDGDNMAYDKKELSAKAGSVVKLKFTNLSKSSGLQHNWVLVQPGQEQAVAEAGVAAGDSSDWIQASDAHILAHTKLIRNAGESDVVVFKAPPAGDYPFICTFPGHYMSMKGVFHSRK